MDIIAGVDSEAVVPGHFPRVLTDDEDFTNAMTTILFNDVPQLEDRIKEYDNLPHVSHSFSFRCPLDFSPLTESSLTWRICSQSQ